MVKPFKGFERRQGEGFERSDVGGDECLYGDHDPRVCLGQSRLSKWTKGLQTEQSRVVNNDECGVSSRGADPAKSRLEEYYS